MRALFSFKSELEKFRDLRTASQMITPMYRALNLEDVMSSAQATMYVPDAVIAQILAFLTERLSSIETLIRSRLCISQTDMFQ